MNYEMLSRWNDLIDDDDIAIHVGDLSAGVGKRYNQLKEILLSLKGKKILIRGNHDHMPDLWYEDAGFKKIFKHINLNGVFLTHYPLENLVINNFDFSNIGVIEHIVHGHHHDPNIPEHENHFNVAVDRHNFIPLEDTRVIPEKCLEKFRIAITDLMK